jgi:serine/threonine protein kinase
LGIRKAVLKLAAPQLGGAGVLMDVLPRVAEVVWDAWSGASTPEQRQQELETLAGLAFDRLQQDVEAIVGEIATDQPPQTQRDLAGYLLHVPSAIRRSLRRPSEPGGLTVPSRMALRHAGDLLRLLPPSRPRFRPGDKPLPGVDWQLEELLGMGGFGEVWKARNPRLASVRPVALKFCLDPAAQDRLLRYEALVLDRVMRHSQHPGIVPLRHTYLGMDPPCLEYEYVEGGDLAGLIQEWHQRGGPTPEQASRAIYQLAGIMAHVHQQNPPIVHRDLKPSNILVGRDPQGKASFRIADFGIGGVVAQKTLEQTRRGNVSQATYRVTSLLGACTPLYASPEQLLGRPPDPRGDVYALGVIWYQLLTGDLAAGAPTGMNWYQQLSARGMSRDLLALLCSCFEKADHRPRDAAALAEALRVARQAPQPRPVPSSGSQGQAGPGRGREAPDRGPRPERKAEGAPAGGAALRKRLLSIVCACIALIVIQGGWGITRWIDSARARRQESPPSRASVPPSPAPAPAPQPQPSAASRREAPSQPPTPEKAPSPAPPPVDDGKQRARACYEPVAMLLKPEDKERSA